DPGESCDDGNTVGGDGCSMGCQSEFCGKGAVEPGEACDDGNNIGGDGCSANCNSNETCGNSITELSEACDTGGESAVCDADCTAATCGDGTLNASAGETCDDGNTTSGDGCS